jgi:hypothetical protein
MDEYTRIQQSRIKQAADELTGWMLFVLDLRPCDDRYQDYFELFISRFASAMKQIVSKTAGGKIDPQGLVSILRESSRFALYHGTGSSPERSAIVASLKAQMDEPMRLLDGSVESLDQATSKQMLLALAEFLTLDFMRVFLEAQVGKPWRFLAQMVIVEWANYIREPRNQWFPLWADGRFMDRESDDPEEWPAAFFETLKSGDPFKVELPD